MSLIIFASELHAYFIHLLAWPIGFFYLCHYNNLLIISFNISLRNNEIFDSVYICKLLINRMSVKENKKRIMHNTYSNQRPRIDFIISSSYYHKKTFFFFVATSFLPNSLALNISLLSYCICIFYNSLFFIFLRLFCSNSIIFFWYVKTNYNM